MIEAAISLLEVCLYAESVVTKPCAVCGIHFIPKSGEIASALTPADRLFIAKVPPI